MTLKRKMLFSATAALLALSTASAVAGDWAVGVSFGYGRSYYRPCYARSVYYDDYAPAVVYRDYDYCPDVTYVAPRAYYYDYYPRAVVYRDYPRYYHKTAFVSRGYYPSHHYTYRAPSHHGSYRAPAHYSGHYRSGGPSRGHHR
jgi:hypothetical protein